MRAKKFGAAWVARGRDIGAGVAPGESLDDDEERLAHARQSLANLVLQAKHLDERGHGVYGITLPARVGIAGDAWNAIIGISLLIVIFFLPEGLYGLIQRLERLTVSPK